MEFFKTKEEEIKELENNLSNYSERNLTLKEKLFKQFEREEEQYKPDRFPKLHNINDPVSGWFREENNILLIFNRNPYIKISDTKLKETNEIKIFHTKTELDYFIEYCHSKYNNFVIHNCFIIKGELKYSFETKFENKEIVDK